MDREPEPNRWRTYRGYEGVREAMDHWLEQFDEYSYGPHQIVDCVDDVLVIAREEGRGGASGATVTGDGYQLFTLRDGKVVRFRGFSDRASALEAAGVGE